MPYWRLYYHVVWSTRRRTPWLTGEAAAIVEAAIRTRAHDLHGLVHAVAVMPDHVHVAVSFPPSLSLAAAIGQLKGVSSTLVQRRQPQLAEDGFCWQGEYGVFSFGELALSEVVAYLANQEAHHRNNTLIRGLEYTGETNRTRADRQESPEKTSV